MLLDKHVRYVVQRKAHLPMGCDDDAVTSFSRLL